MQTLKEEEQQQNATKTNNIWEKLKKHV